MLVHDLFQPQALPEARANRSQSQAILGDASLLMGFECEMTVPGFRETVDPNDLSFDHLSPLLDPRDVAQVKRAALEWSRENEIDGPPDIDQFIATEFGSNGEMMNSYRFRGAYGETDEGLIYATDAPEQEQTHQDLAERLRDGLGLEWVEVNDAYHSEDKMIDTWYIEPDMTISTHDADRIPAEVVSAVYPLGEALGKLDDMFAFMKAENAITDASTGLHINLSIDGKAEDDYDFLKMLLLFDENNVATMFDRLGNTNAKTMRDKLRGVIGKLVGRDPMNLDARALLDSTRLAEVLFTLRIMGQRLVREFTKYHSIRNRDNGVFEFRSMGGAGYENRFDDVRRQVVNMAHLLKLGSDEKLEVQTYLTKLVLLLDAGKFDDSKPGSGRDRPALPAMLSAFGRFANAHTAGLAVHEPVRFVAEIGAFMALRGVRLDRTQTLQLRRYVITQRVSPAQVEAECRDDNCFNALAQLFNWPKRDDVQSPWGQDDDVPEISDIAPAGSKPR